MVTTTATPGPDGYYGEGEINEDEIDLSFLDEEEEK